MQIISSFLFVSGLILNSVVVMVVVPVALAVLPLTLVAMKLQDMSGFGAYLAYNPN